MSSRHELFVVIAICTLKAMCGAFLHPDTKAITGMVDTNGPTLRDTPMPKKKYQVIKATTRDIPGLTVGGRVKKFAANGTFETDDAGEAAEIDKVLGAKGTGEVVVTNYTDSEPGHRYTFRGVDIRARGGGERVRVKTKDGYTFVSRAVAEEEGYTIVPQKRITRRKGVEVTHGENAV